jgi:PAS domain S-box-containing protein
MLETLEILLGIAALLCLTVAVLLILRLRNVGKKLKIETTSEENYRRITKESNDSLFVIDIADGKVLECNFIAAMLLGYSEAELKQQTIFQLHPQALLAKSSETIADTWEAGGKVYADLPYLTKQGELIPMESSAKVMPFDGRPVIAIYARDIRERLRLQNEILKQSNIIEEKNKDLTDSINYARRIQNAILPTPENLNTAFPQNMLLYIPKDIVSGDFYWCLQIDTWSFFAVADCTGHGVPGAFMSMLGSTLLKEIVQNRGVRQPSLILENLHNEIRRSLRQDAGGASLDGMDIALIAYERATNTLNYAGAYRDLLYFEHDTAADTYTLHEVDADRRPVGGKQDETDQRHYTHYNFTVKSGDMVYMFTDGYPDQFGGEQGRKYMSKKFVRNLAALVPTSLEHQRSELEKGFFDWKNNYEQMDDVLVGGIRF